VCVCVCVCLRVCVCVSVCVCVCVCVCGISASCLPPRRPFSLGRPQINTQASQLDSLQTSQTPAGKPTAWCQGFQAAYSPHKVDLDRGVREVHLQTTHTHTH